MKTVFQYEADAIRAIKQANMARLSAVGGQ